MLFDLADTLCDCPSQMEEQVIVGMTNLLIGYYEGNLLLMASDFLCSHFENRIKEGRALRALNHLAHNNSYNYDIKWKIKIVLNNSEIIDINHFPISFFYSTSSIQPVKILGENELDALFYVRLTELTKGLNNLKCQTLNGGGSSMASVFKNIQTENNCFCLAIVDTDKRYPTAPFGQTYQSLLSAHYSKRNNMRILPVEVHEVENLLPFSFLKEVTNHEGRTFIDKIHKNNIIECLKFYDIKEGISIDKTKDPLYNQFSRDIYENIYNSKKTTYECFLEQKRRKKKLLFPVIRKDALKVFMNKKKPSININFFYSEWERIADEVYAFVCSRSSDPIN